jgi:hypothetical protein
MAVVSVSRRRPPSVVFLDYEEPTPPSLRSRRSYSSSRTRPPHSTPVRWIPPKCRLREELVSVDLEVSGDIGEDRRERAHFQGSVARDGHMVLEASGCRGKADMASGLACRLVAIPAEPRRELVAGEVPRKRQAGMTSSRTTWRRISDGRSISSKWQRTASRTAARSSARLSACVCIEWPTALASNPPSGESVTVKTISTSAVIVSAYLGAVPIHGSVPRAVVGHKWRSATCASRPRRA